MATVYIQFTTRIYIYLCIHVYTNSKRRKFIIRQGETNLHDGTTTRANYTTTTTTATAAATTDTKFYSCTYTHSPFEFDHPPPPSSYLKGMFWNSGGKMVLLPGGSGELVCLTNTHTHTHRNECVGKIKRKKVGGGTHTHIENFGINVFWESLRRTRTPTTPRRHHCRHVQNQNL